MPDYTSIRATEELADELYDRKNRGESYEDVIWGLIEAADGETAERTSKAPREPPEGELDAGDADVDRGDLRDALAGEGDLLKQRVDAIETMYGYLRSGGEASKRELLALVDPDEVGYASEESVWSNMVKGKDTLSALPGVEPPPTGRSTWRYSE